MLIKAFHTEPINDWFRRTHKKIVPVQIEGIPSVNEESTKEVKPEIVKEKGHIMVFIQNRDGLQIKKKNLTYYIGNN